MNAAVLFVFILGTLVTSNGTSNGTDNESLIKDLGSEKYSVREKATRILLKQELDAIPILKAHRNDKDPEVKYRVKYILDEIINLPIHTDELPSLWSMPNRIRYEDDLDDRAKNIYEELYFEVNNIGTRLLFFGFNVDRINYDSRHLERVATRRFFIDLRLEGWSHQEIDRLRQEMMGYGTKTYRQLDFTWKVPKPLFEIESQHQP